MVYTLIQEDLKRLFVKKFTWMAIILYLLIAVANLMFIRSEEPVGNPDFTPTPAFEYFVMIQGGGSGVLMIFLPLLVTLATGDFFIKERRSSLLSYSLMRASMRQYICCKLASIGVISFLFLFLCQLLLFIGLLTVFPLTKPSVDNVFYATDLFLHSPWMYCILIIFNSALMAFFYSCLTIIVGIVFRNFYVSIMLPYVSFIGLSEVFMSLPLLIDGQLGGLFYDLAPMSMAGEYITNTFYWAVIPLYWIVLGGLSFLLAIWLFEWKFQREKLLLL
ncbi:hypothetical protein MUB24_12685 [Lederbergia sp. NSJ-179]|uniref:hypothetical protein n=1 Tax=Lederbergia sp. NSJ-179 TaxID=2931402 RepID=UPI001FD117F2|nr:hypothetical protein [Lederbergia sp. NSJ-179]MCJ7841738.1 hypothetical protein [Lederbergia sp. NSJ-179]